jgi:hypothetical protein
MLQFLQFSLIGYIIVIDVLIYVYPRNIFSTSKTTQVVLIKKKIVIGTTNNNNIEIFNNGHNKLN